MPQAVFLFVHKNSFCSVLLKTLSILPPIAGTITTEIKLFSILIHSILFLCVWVIILLDWPVYGYQKCRISLIYLSFNLSIKYVFLAKTYWNQFLSPFRYRRFPQLISVGGFFIRQIKAMPNSEPPLQRSVATKVDSSFWLTS